jgi:hypothetical protein
MQPQTRELDLGQDLRKMVTTRRIDEDGTNVRLGDLNDVLAVLRKSYG